MSTTTKITVVCPNCGAEVTLSFRRVDVQTEGVVTSWDGTETVTGLSTDVVAAGPHRCASG